MSLVEKKHNARFLVKEVTKSEAEAMPVEVLILAVMRLESIHAAVVTTNQERTLEFAHWFLAEFNYGINYRLAFAMPGCVPADLAQAMDMIFDATGIAEVFVQVVGKFRQMVPKRAFKGMSCGTGIEEGELSKVGEAKCYGGEV